MAMFEPSDTPRFFTVALGHDFPQAVIDGLQTRLENKPPHATANVELFVNTRRMERRLNALFLSRGAGLLPKIKLITDLATSPGLSTLPQPVDPLGRRLELRQLVKQLLDAKPELAPIHAALDHADTLAALIEEMHGEGVSLETVLAQDLGDHAAHWQQTAEFLSIISPFFDGTRLPSFEARQRDVVECLIARWRQNPPQHPIIIAGSTGSRGTTAQLMQAVAKLPQGAVILPGFDAEMPPEAWVSVDHDHPQFRLFQLLNNAGLTPNTTPSWTKAPTPNEPRAKLISLALRPAPITDAWLSEGPKLEALDTATKHLSLLEVESPRDEALAIAFRLRAALEEGKRAAVITPDRTLTRRVAAALDQWQLLPDDSAGTPLQQTPAGQLARQTAMLLGKSPSPSQLLALLKHPSVTNGERGPHLLKTRDFELGLLRGGPPQITPEVIAEYSTTKKGNRLDPEWLNWLSRWLKNCADATASTLAGWTTHHRNLTLDLTGEDWAGEDVALILETLGSINKASDQGGETTALDYDQILSDLLSRCEVRNALAPHPDLMIWGTLEARVQGADLVILAGLNEGIWPETPDPDPWLNRTMRAQAALFLPERQIGLSAHDFQQGIMAPEVLLTRSKRDAEAETVPSRWLNRLTSLLGGLPETGHEALDEMRKRGANWSALVHAMEHTASRPAAKRPSPCPPAKARPKELPVTRIEWLIRDPYAVYARYVLGLYPLDDLSPQPSPALRGQVLHDVMEAFIKATADQPTVTAEALMAAAAPQFEHQIAWPAIRALWLARFQPAAEHFANAENTRRGKAVPKLFEVKGARMINSLDFTLTGRADRIDIGPQGASIYDYKSGSAPTAPQEKHFNKQLPLLASIASEGGFKDLPKSRIDEAGYLLIGTNPTDVIREYTSEDLARAWSELEALIMVYQDPSKGFSARRAVEESRWDQPYDHLARYGEWDTTDDAHPEDVGK